MLHLPNDILEWYCCPCCGYPTFTERGSYGICGICGYEDDGLDDDKPEEISGPNDDYSLTEMRANFEKYRTMYRIRNEHIDRRRLSDTGYEVVKKLLGKYRWVKGSVILTKEDIDTLNKLAI